MIIQSLKVVLDEAELSAKLKDRLASVNQLRDATLGLAPGVIKIGGKFQVGLSIPFETQWRVDVAEQGSRLAVKLAAVSVGFFGMSAATVSAQVMSALAQKLQGVSGVAVENDTILIDPAVLLAANGIRLEASVRRVEVLQGRVEIDVG